MRVAITWEMFGYIDVNAETMAGAIHKVAAYADDYALPSKSYYVDGSLQPATYDAEEMRKMCR